MNLIRRGLLTPLSEDRDDKLRSQFSWLEGENLHLEDQANHQTAIDLCFFIYISWLQVVVIILLQALLPWCVR